MTDWLSNFGHWLLVSQAGLFVGAALIWLGILSLAAYFVWRYGDVRMGPPPPRPSKLLSEATTVIVPAVEAAPNYHRDLMPAADRVAHDLDVVAEAVTDVIPVVDPPAPELAVTEVIDYRTPLFYEIRRRPRPFELETFTEGITRAQLERVREGKP